MNNTIILPVVIGDGRIDWAVKLLNALKSSELGGSRIKSGKTCFAGMTHICLEWGKTEKISPAGMAILACLFDSFIEKNISVTNKHIKKSLKEIPVVRNFLEIKQFRDLPSPSIHNIENRTVLLRGFSTALDTFFSERVYELFSDKISEDIFYAGSLISNELMQNCLDHANAERFYGYAGVWGNEWHVGFLDMGVSIPAKLEQKYTCPTDLDYIELAIKEGTSTRRIRTGGFGLYYFFDLLKNHKGKLTIASRRAQLRRYFKTRRSQKNELKYPLSGTWCFARFTLEK